MTFANLTVKTKTTGLVVLACLALVAVGTLGLLGLRETLNDIQVVYTQNLKPTAELAQIHDLLDEQRMLLYRAQLKVNVDLSEMEGNNAKVDALWKAYAPTISLPDEQKLASEFRKHYEPWRDALLEKRDAIKAGDNDKASEISRTKTSPLDQPVRAGLDALIRMQDSEAADQYDQALARAAHLRGWMIGIFSFAFIGLIAIGFFLVRGIVKALNSAVEVAGSIAAGKLGNRIEVRNHDEIGNLLEALKVMEGRLTEIVGKVRTGAENVQVAARQISQGNDDLSQRTQEQASSLEETASSMEEMTATVRQTADNALHANQLARGARELAEKGGAVVSRAVSAMTEINTASGQISQIISVIDEIAFQTNLLALNAAVEAARAGEQGRGFAVVAAEVRNLAQRSAGAAREIKSLITDSAEKVQAGSSLVNESGKALADIVDSVKKVTDIVAEIAAASQEQSAGIDQVTRAVSQMDEVTQQNAALVEEAAAASRAMSEQALALSEEVSFFQIEGADAQQPAAGTTRARAVAPARAPQPMRQRELAAAGEWNEF